MDKEAERIIILLDLANGLLARVYNMCEPHFVRPATLDVTVDKVCKLLLKSFPDHPDSRLESTAGNDIFNKRSQEIVSDLRHYYMTYLDVINFCDNAETVLKRLSSSIVAFKLSVNDNLTRQWLDLLVGYVRLQLLLERVYEPKLMLSAYARAFHRTHGNTESNLMRIASFMEDRAVDIFGKIRGNCDEIINQLGETLMDFQMHVGIWSNVDTLIQKRIFGVLEEAKDMASDKGFEDLYQLGLVDKLHEWILFGFLVCTQELSRQGAPEMLTGVLSSHFVIPLYRDEVYDIHAAYDHLVSKFKFNKFKLSSHKKLFKESYNNPHDTVERHRALRTYLRVELHSLLHLLEEFPQLCAPKVTLILTALRVARIEVEWYVTHRNQKPFKGKEIKPEEFDDENISQLIHLIDRTSSILLENENYVGNEYVKTICSEDVIDLEKVVQDFIQNGKASQAINGSIQGVLNDLKSVTINSDFEAIRLNWYRIVAQINSHNAMVAVNKCQLLHQAMNKVIMHTRLVDRLPSLIRQNASLKSLYFHPGLIQYLLQSSLSGFQGQPAYVMSIVRLVHSALDNVHRICPEEQISIGRRSVELTEEYLGMVSRYVESLMTGITNKQTMFRAQLSPVYVFHVRNKEVSPPGTESLHQNRNTVHDVYAWRKQLSELCGAVRESGETLIVYDTQFSPQDFILQSARLSIRRSINSFALPDGIVQRPTVLLGQVKDLIRSWYNVQSHLNIDITTCIREVLFEMFSDLSVGGTGEVFTVPDGPTSDPTSGKLLHTIMTWYLDILIGKELNATGRRITYSGIKQGFVSRPQKGDKRLEFQSEYFMDASEIQALCRLAGPFGVRAMERSLLSEIAVLVKKIQSVLIANKEALIELKEKFTEPETWHTFMQTRIRGVDELTGASIQIGALLKFRSLLKSAMADLSAEIAPFLFKTASALQQAQSRDHVAQMRSFDVLVSDLGGSELDETLRTVLKRFKQTAGDEAIWQLLPEMYATCFVGKIWSEASYQIDTESHGNNVHLLASTINTLIVVLTSIPIEGRDVAPNVKELTKGELERFTRNAAYSILHMNSSKLHTLYPKYRDFPIQSIMVFVEQFVRETGVLQLSILEDFFPFTLLRTTYIQMYEKQDVKGQSYAVLVDDNE